MFSDDLCVYDMRMRRWDKRTPNGVGWYPHLYSMFDLTGKRTDDFDQFLKLNVEDPAAPALKKLATGVTLNANERSAVALFMALTAARSPELMNSVMTAHLNDLGANDLAQLDELLKMWCVWTKRPFNSESSKEFLKPSSFGAIWDWSWSLQRRFLQWEWHLVRTTKDMPFVTSDRPVLLQRDQDVNFVSFPVSSEVALIVMSGGQFNEARDRAIEVHAMNRGTMNHATTFVVACRQDFPGVEYLNRRDERT